MSNQAKLVQLIKMLLLERGEEMLIPLQEAERFRLFRALCNIREPIPAPSGFLALQDEFLQELLTERGTVELTETEAFTPQLALWKGDITRLKADAIVNAANSGMLGCFVPNHACIDNCIHTYAGVQLRIRCNELMQGTEEPTGRARITAGYNLPCRYVLHTVGPIVSGGLTTTHERLLASCYRSCLELAEQNGVRSLAFCCISTGVFRFPKHRAAEIAVKTVQEYLRESGSTMQVIFNVFQELDESIYREVLNR